MGEQISLDSESGWRWDERPPQTLCDEIYETLKRAVEQGHISKEQAGERYEAWFRGYRAGEQLQP